MNQESEQQQKNDEQYVMFDVGSDRFLCLPMDCFIEYNSSLIILKRDGWGEDATFNYIDKPLDFKMIDQDFINAAKVKARMLAAEEAKV